MRNPTVCAAILALLLGAGTASAHHAFSSDFDQNKLLATAADLLRGTQRAGRQ